MIDFGGQQFIAGHRPRQTLRDSPVGGISDFTCDRAEGPEHQVLREDFCCRTETCLSRPERYGLTVPFMDDRERPAHGRSKIRGTHEVAVLRRPPRRSW